jgi:hypothetical protein
VSQGSSSFFLNTIYYSPRRNPETSKEFHPMLQNSSFGNLKGRISIWL